MAALLGGLVSPAPAGTTALVISGGNVDAGLLAELARRHETLAGRRLVLETRSPEHAGEVEQAVRAAGYETRVLR